MKKIVNIYWNEKKNKTINKYYILKANKVSLDKIELSIDNYSSQLTNEKLRKPKSVVCEELIKFISVETNYSFEKIYSEVDNVDISLNL